MFQGKQIICRYLTKCSVFLPYWLNLICMNKFLPWHRFCARALILLKQQLCCWYRVTFRKVYSKPSGTHTTQPINFNLVVVFAHIAFFYRRTSISTPRRRLLNQLYTTFFFKDPYLFTLFDLKCSDYSTKFWEIWVCNMAAHWHLQE